MGKKIYLLREEMNQEDFSTKVKYLYKSELNKNMVTLMESMSNHYIYISNNFGILFPNEEKEPYKIKVLNGKNKKVWALFCSEMVKRYCVENNISVIVLFSSCGEFYKEFEDRLKWYGFKIENPMKYFKTKEIKNRWIINEIRKNIVSGFGF
jgi:hypothetical protein